VFTGNRLTSIILVVIINLLKGKLGLLLHLLTSYKSLTNYNLFSFFVAVLATAAAFVVATVRQVSLKTY